VLDALDRLASGIAQEIQSPVQYVGGNLEFMGNTFMRLVEALDRLSAAALDADGDEAGLAAALAELLDDEELRFLLEETPAAIRESHEGLRRVAAIVHAVGRLARPDGQDARTADVAEAVRDMLVATRSVWKYVADVETAIAPELPAALVPPSALCRALLAIFLQAADAVDLRLGGRAGKGRIAVAVSRRGEALEVVVENAGPKPAEDAVIAPEARAGLDRQLGRARGLLHRHGADMEVVAGEAGESTVVVRLPLALGQTAIGA
jgi:signal transduction histidine kinase